MLFAPYEILYEDVHVSCVPIQPPARIERLASGFIPASGLVVDVEGERYRIEAGDVESLIFAGRPGVENLWFSPAPVLKDHHTPVVRERCDGATGLTIEGHAAVDPAGRAVAIRTRAGAWIVPLVLFRRVACGEEVRAAVFGVVTDGGSLGTDI